MGDRGILRAVTALVLTTVSLGATAVATEQGSVDSRRLEGPNRYATAAAIAADAWGRVDAVVIADGGVATEALVGAHLAARLSAPLLLSVNADQDDPAPAETVEAMTRLAPETVYVVNGAVVPEGVGQRFARVPVVGGSAALLAAAALDAVPGEPAMPVVVASSATFADALSAANLAPARLLFTAPDRLDPATVDAIARLDPAQVLVVGGPAAIADTVSDQIGELGPAVRRVAGPNRYATSVAAAGLTRDIVGSVSSEPSTVLLSGQNWPDAVAIVPWAAARTAQVLLTTQRELPPETAAVLSGQSGERRQVVVGGGTVAVGNFVDEQAVALLGGAPEPGANASVRTLTTVEQLAMTGVSWRADCPVGLGDLRVIQTRYFHPDGNVRAGGQLIVHRDSAEDVAGVLGELFAARFPIVRMEPVRNFGADDDTSMDADNTSAFNCRTVAGTSRWSQHAYGRAIDINPIENPFVTTTRVVPEAGQDFVDRTDVRPGMILPDGPVVAAFDQIGWGWGGDFTSSADYQHFSRSGS